MKIAITATGPSLDAELDPRFGRCPCFLIVDTENLSFQAVSNENQALGQGAGIQSARLVVEQGVSHVLTGNCGPNAHRALTAAGVGVIVGCSGTARQVVAQFNTGQLNTVDGPNVPGHSGMSTTPGANPTPAPNPAVTPNPGMTPPSPAGEPAFGPGQGRGMGRGQGGGMGRGMGRGQGRGMGGGMGRGMGGGRGR